MSTLKNSYLGTFNVPQIKMLVEEIRFQNAKNIPYRSITACTTMRKGIRRSQYTRSIDALYSVEIVLIDVRFPR